MNGLFAACVEDVNLQTERVCRPLNVSRLNLESRIVRVQEHGDQCGRRNQVAQKPEPFPLHHGNEKAAPCRAADADRQVSVGGDQVDHIVGRSHSTNLSSQIIEAARLMARASTAVLKENEMIACSVASRRRGLVRIDTSEVCEAAPNEVAK